MDYIRGQVEMFSIIFAAMNTIRWNSTLVCMEYTGLFWICPSFLGNKSSKSQSANSVSHF